MSIVVTGNSNGTSQVQNLNLGFVGLGWIGRKRMEQLLTHPHITCSAIVEPEPEQAKKARQTIQALEAGKAVFCQKPLGRNQQEVREVITASSKADQLVSIDLSYKFTRAFTSIYEIHHSGSTGNIFAVVLVLHIAYGLDDDWCYDLSHSGGVCVLDLGVHMLDLARCSLDFPSIDLVGSQQ